MTRTDVAAKVWIVAVSIKNRKLQRFFSKVNSKSNLDKTNENTV
jgi:hypothetical protein